MNLPRLSLGEFEAKLVEAVEEALTEFDVVVKREVLFHLEKRHGIRLGEIPAKIEEFSQGLRDIFGIGAEVLERRIGRKLAEKLGVEYDRRTNESFSSYVNRLKTAYAQRI